MIHPDLNDGDNSIWEQYEDVSQTIGDINQRAHEFGCAVRFAGKLEVFIDLDTQEAWDHFTHQWNWFQIQMPELLAPDYLEEISKGGNRHITVGLLREVADAEKLLIASLLGSDLKRELLNYTRLKANGDALSCFFIPGHKLLGDGGSDERGQ